MRGSTVSLFWASPLKPSLDPYTVQKDATSRRSPLSGQYAGRITPNKMARIYLPVLRHVRSRVLFHASVIVLVYGMWQVFDQGAEVGSR